MADTAAPAYGSTTESIPNKSNAFCGSELDRKHFILKLAQLVLSFIAFICEEVIPQCESCGGLYFFEFVSCSAFLIAILMLVVYWTPLKRKIAIPQFKKIDFYVTTGIGGFFVIASIVFVATMDDNELGKVSVAFGFIASIAFLLEAWFMYRDGYLTQKTETPTPGTNGTVEREPLNIPVQVSA